VKFNYIISKPHSERLFSSLGKEQEGILYMEKWFFRGLQHYITFELRHDLKKVAISDPPPSVDFVEFVF